MVVMRPIMVGREQISPLFNSRLVICRGTKFGMLIALKLASSPRGNNCHSKYKKLNFGCEPQKFLISRDANDFSVASKFL